MEKYIQYAMQSIGKMIKYPHSIQGNIVSMENMSIAVYINDVKSQNDRFSAALSFEVRSHLLTEPFVDMSAAISNESEEHAIFSAIATFMLSTYCSWDHLFKGEFTHKLESDFNGRKLSWEVASGCGGTVVSNIKDAPNLDMFNVIKEKLSTMLPAEILCYMKLYGCKQFDGSVIGEVRINNIVSLELSEMIKTYIENANIGEGFYSIKEMHLFKQSEKTFIPYPHSRDKIEAYVLESLKMFEAELKNEQIIENLTKITGDASIAEEICFLIPEAAAERYWNSVTYCDNIQASTDDGRNLKVYKWQMSAYNTIMGTLFGGNLNNELYKKLILRSCIASAIFQVLEQDSNADLSTLRFGALLMNFSGDYQLR